MEKREIIERGTKAKQLADSAFFRDTVEACKAFAVERLGRTEPRQIEERERLHAVIYNFNLVMGQLHEWEQDAAAALRDIEDEEDNAP